MSFKDKKRIKFVTLKGGTRMEFEDRLAYSFLLPCSHGLTAARLAALSGIDRTRTLPKVLTRLAESRLITKEGNRYCAMPSDCVVANPDRKGAESWYDTICYLKFYLPSKECPLTKKQLAVYYLKQAGKNSTSLIAKLLNVSRPTVVSAVKALKQHGLLDPLGDPVAVPLDKSCWWQDKEKVKAQRKGDLERIADDYQQLITTLNTSRFDWIYAHDWRAEFSTFGRLSKAAGYVYPDVVTCLEKAIEQLHGHERPVARVFRELSKLVQKAEDATRKNRRLHGFKGSSSFGMFRCKLNDLVKGERRKMATAAS